MKRDVGGGDISVSERCDIIWKNLPSMSKEDIETIQKATIEQSRSNLWHKARVYRITASKCHDVMTRMNTLERDQTQTADNLIKRVLSANEVMTPAMELGKKWENKAVERYKRISKIHHSGLIVSKCGIFVGDAICIGASPDGIITCDCHGDGVLEVKCATKFWNLDPKSDEVVRQLPYLMYQAGKICLNKKHKYYSQVQFQMGITTRRWCDFVVFTSLCMADEISPLIVNVQFDEDHFTNLEGNATKFWRKYILPEILSCDSKEAEDVTMDEATPAPIHETHIMDHMYSLTLDINNSTLCTCPACHTVCHDQENVKTFGERSVACDHCNAWFHFRCVEITPQKLRDLKGHNWYCPLCRHE